MFEPTDKEEIKKWVEENIIDKVVLKLNKKSSNVSLKISFPEKNFLLSSIIFAELKFSNNLNPSENEEDTVNLVIKRPSLLELSNNILHLDALFHNEILFYEKFLKNEFINKNEFPRCFYTAEDKSDFARTVIVMEHIEYMGYEVYSKSSDVPFEYIISAMQAIGRFHAMGYVMKINKPSDFMEIVNDLKEYRFFPEEMFGKFINLVSVRPVEWLKKKNYDPIFIDKMEKFLTNAFENVMFDAVKPIEPLAVLCHGDFTKNNIFFRNTNRGLESMLIDFAMLRYSPPSIDISTFLYLHCSREDRNKRFTDIFKAYHDAIINYLQENGIKSLENYSYINFLNDYKRHAMFGYIIAIFFLPVIRGSSSLSAEEAKNFDAEKMSQTIKEVGGDVFSEELANVLLDIRECGYLDHVLKV
ncbi:uncharacterized protein LOC130668031 [Microplitis mediator]|uniref:uncharacterized protein LOC130668031 n=1 Tax=Microplitis mediator TaxID=375433 RepID=UPI002556D9B2|nr:uncharacterized protein LOC130668031 [Microplitis mediator]